MRRSTTAEVNRLIAEAEARDACATSSDRRLRRALDTRVGTGELVSPRPGLYARTETWDARTPAERALMVIVGAHDAHPGWVFCGTSAAVAHGLSVSNRLLSSIEVVRTTGRHPVRACDVTPRYVDDDEVSLASGVPVTTVARTVFDCARHHGFVEGLAVADSALRLGLAKHEELVSYAHSHSLRYRGAADARLATSLADGRSANGGESIARATIYALGFALPELQVPIVDPVSPSRTYYADYLWVLADGTVVIGEHDGGEKYVNPLMNGGSSLVALREERLRESRLTIGGARVVRFTPADVAHPERLERLLTVFGVPRDHEPLPVPRAADSCGEPPIEVVPTGAYGLP